MHAWLKRLMAVWLACAMGLPGAGLAQAPAPATGGEKRFTQEQLDQMLAPIALYPDALLAQILMASTYPLEVVSAARWSQANPKVSGKALENAMRHQTWDPSVKSLTAFPTTLQMMNDKIEWTQQLGDAFLAQRENVMTSVQALRYKAYAQGSLKSTEQQKVVVQKETIVIQPATSVVYVPVYNPTVVYGTWWYPAYVPYYWYPPGYVYRPGVAFATGVVVGAALWGGVNWHRNEVNININHYNQFNHTHITSATWQHNAVHRKGVPYRDPTLAQKYNRNQTLDTAQRNRNRDEAADAVNRNQNRNQALDTANQRQRRNQAADAANQAGSPGSRDTTDRPGSYSRNRPGDDNGPDRQGPGSGPGPGRPGPGRN